MFGRVSLNFISKKNGGKHINSLFPPVNLTLFDDFQNAMASTNLGVLYLLHEKAEVSSVDNIIKGQDRKWDFVWWNFR